MKNYEQVLVNAFDTTTGGLKVIQGFITNLEDLGSQSIALSDVWTSGDIDVRTKTEIVVNQKAVYDSDAILGTACKIYASLDATNFDTDAYSVFGPDFVAGSTKQKTRRADVRGLNTLRLESQNLDSTQAVTAQNSICVD